jgi:hypothetical protein
MTKGTCTDVVVVGGGGGGTINLTATHHRLVNRQVMQSR